jgi:thiamine-phosphate pyrophosphorylase
VKRFAITDGTLTSGGDGSDLERLAERCAELGRQGVEFLLLREKQLSERELYLATRRVLKAIEDSRTLVMVAGRPQVALAAAADGVHVGSDYAMVREAKRVFLESWVSVSCHSLADVKAARAAGADVCLFGPVFGKTVDGVEVVPGVGLEALREACAVAGKDLPVFALGGVSEANSGACVEAGASGVAGIRMFFATEGTERVSLPIGS